MDTMFSEDEKRFVLGEMIKASKIDISTLVEFIRAHHVTPEWMVMQLPGGRNMQQCYNAVQNMFQVNYPPPSLSFKRKSLSDLVDHPPKRQAMMAPIEPPIAPVRVIQPRPPPNGYQTAVPVGGSLTAAAASSSSTGKKRGRPSKADKEAQARANYSRPTEYTPITPAPLAPINLQPQREYASSSPGYEVASGSADQKPKKRGGMPTTIDSPQPASSSFLLASPRSATDTPRALPEPLEHVDRATLSPRDRGSAPFDARSPPLLPHLQQQQQQDPSHTHPPSQSRTQTLPPFQPLPRTTTQQAYERNRSIDPIFPDRDRTRNMPAADRLPKNSPPPPPPATTVGNRS
ncbi:hypothetical protein F4779DRAFT_344513 [Xylariaceae sp. FL0662B]|nr:hypothetical protein F4779DRAFT_344513 [Xylariaceae sp. FL0662B]